MDAYDIEIREKVDELVEHFNIGFHQEKLDPEELSYWTYDRADWLCDTSQEVLFYCIQEYFGYDFDDTKDLFIKRG